jgi:SAM-dependent methyltransferase
MLRTQALLNHVKRKYRRQLRPIYRAYRSSILGCNPLRTGWEKQRLLSDPRLSETERSLLSAVSSRISRRDTMYRGDGRRYFRVGLSAIECIDEALAAGGPGTVDTVLDLPCGHGRVLRFLKQRFPHAALTACEIDADGVEFCRRQFGARPQSSRADLENLRFSGQFDLIWCGSLVTHLSAEDTRKLLAVFKDHLTPGGLLVFTAHGETVADRFRTNDADYYGLADDDAAKMLASYESTGHGYADYPRRVSGYGLSLTSRDWLLGEIDRIGGWRPTYFGARRWESHHDVHGVRKDAANER